MDCSSCKRCLSLFYDTLTACVSLLDVVTDVLVMIQFYNKGRIVFFIASLTILIIAHLTYILSFWGRHHPRNSPLLSISLFFLLIPVAPFISFLFYIVADEQRYKLLISNTFCLNKLIYNNPYTSYVNNDKSAIKQWMQMKLYKHIGFIIEALFEALPQSILQLIAIIYYNESVTYLMIISILLSMISVCSKSFAFSITVSINIKSMIFTWLCCATDFISIFTTCSIIFYGLTHPNLSNAFYSIQKIFLYKIIICVLPMTFIASIGINLYATIHYISYSIHNHNSIAYIILYSITITLFIQLIWIVVTCLAVMSMEVACLIWFVALFHEIGLNHRLAHTNNNSQQFYLQLIQWIKDSNSVSCNATKFYIHKNQNRLIRIFAINKVLLITNTQISNLKTEWHNNKIDDKLLHFINNKQDNDLCNIQKLNWKDFRINTDHHNSSFFHKKFWYKYYGKLWLKYTKDKNNKFKYGIGLIMSTLITFILGPIYFFSRLLNLLFPAFVVLYLYFWHDIIFWYGYIDPFQVTILIIYILFLFASFSVLFFSGILAEEYYAWHILPISETLNAPKSYSITEGKFIEIKHYYNDIVFVPIITDLIYLKFNHDIAKVIMTYFHQILMHHLHEDSYSHSYEYDNIYTYNSQFDGYKEGENNCLKLKYNSHDIDMVNSNGYFRVATE